jgi:hypothetical protein
MGSLLVSMPTSRAHNGRSMRPIHCKRGRPCKQIAVAIFLKHAKLTTAARRGAGVGFPSTSPSLRTGVGNDGFILARVAPLASAAADPLMASVRDPITLANTVGPKVRMHRIGAAPSVVVMKRGNQRRVLFSGVDSTSWRANAFRSMR